jgi:hypothetical protein
VKSSVKATWETKWLLFQIYHEAVCDPPPILPIYFSSNKRRCLGGVVEYAVAGVRRGFLVEWEVECGLKRRNFVVGTPFPPPKGTRVVGRWGTPTPPGQRNPNVRRGHCVKPTAEKP